MKLACVLVLVITTSQAQQIPAQFSFPLTSQSVNGSSAVGHCTGATKLSDRYQCDDPTSSVVYDGHIPTLIGLDGNMWASQLLTINASSAVLTFDFTGTPNFQVRRVEMVVFNCPQWGISLLSVVLTDSVLTQLGAANPALSSCDSLLRVCIPDLTITSQAVLRLEFTTLEPPTDRIHIAEVGFYGDTDTCPPDILIHEPTTAPMLTTDTTTGNEIDGTTGEITANTTPQADLDTTTDNTTTDNTTQSMTQCPSCSTSTTLASVITAITTALLATLIFVLLQIALCKYHPKFTLRKPEAVVAWSGGEEIPVYEEVNWGVGGVIANSLTYMEVGAEGESTIHIQRNEAYATTQK